MPAQIAIIHGWSDSSKSFGRLKTFLEGNGYDAADIWLGDYLSLDDDVRVEDVAKRMESVLRTLIKRKQLREPFDLIVHSTGGLVAREWVATFYPKGTGCPAKRILMLAPANFGSRLAALGKSMVGRLTKGFDNWFQTGEQMLRSLELASPYQWRLTARDLLDPTGGGGEGPYGHGKIWPFVITGSRGYPDGLRTVVNEEGSDGTVRGAAANLNAYGLTVDFTANSAKPKVTAWTPRLGAARVPFALLPDRDHGSIIDPGHSALADRTMGSRLGRLLLQALRCQDDAAYDAIAAKWDEVSEFTVTLSGNRAAIDAAFDQDRPKPESFHQYMQFLVRAQDDHGQPVDDFFLEFFAPDTESDAEVIYFHKEVLEHAHTNTILGNHRCLFIDRTDLIQNFYKKVPADKQQLAVSVSAARIGPNIRYFDATAEGARGHVLVHALADEQRNAMAARLHRNSTHLIDLILPRQPLDKVFKIAN